MQGKIEGQLEGEEATGGETDQGHPAKLFRKLADGGFRVRIPFLPGGRRHLTFGVFMPRIQNTAGRVPQVANVLLQKVELVGSAAETVQEQANVVSTSSSFPEKWLIEKLHPSRSR